ncbi:MAG: hypothetical protein KatS3mg102_2866 [Planctomycetota bacterium]|nr:MAG: hypothetical protein KatS3mg102_2866 [Planctomycetota bacterium]
MRRPHARSRCAPAMLAGAAALAALAACQAPAQGGSPGQASGARATAPRPVEPPKPFDPYPVIAVRKVLLEGRARGFIKLTAHPAPGGRGEVHLVQVYDEQFQLRGWLHDDGLTYRVTREGQAVSLGRLPHEDGLRALLDGKAEDEVRLVAMDRPPPLP